MTTKKGFDFARNSIYVADPEDLCIIGGQWLPEGERGPIDTAHREGEHDLFDTRIYQAITPESVANIDAYGVKQSILIAKDKETGSPVVVDGRGRVRRARLANLQRKARGEPPIKIECRVERDTGTRLLGAMISLNEVRVDDDVATKVSKLKTLMGRGVSEDDAAVIFGVKVGTVRGWLAYDDNATPELKAAVAAGEVSATAAAKVARVKDVEKQREVLEKVKASPKKTVTAARAVIGSTTKPEGKGDGVGLSGKREQRALLNEVNSMSGKDVAPGDLLFWEGVEAALALVTGQGEPDRRLKKLLKKLGWSD